MLAAYSAPTRVATPSNNLLLRKLLSDASSHDFVTFEDEAQAPAGFAELAPAW